MATRRANGDGTLRQRKDGSWEYRANLGVGLDGKQVHKSFYGKNKTQAKSKGAEYLKQCETPIEKVKTVGEWAVQWLEIYKKDKIAYKSYKNYEMYINKHIIPALGGLKLEQVRPAHLEKFYLSKMDLSGAARRDMHTVLRGVFETAIDNKLCSDNPALKADPKKSARTEVKVFPPADIKKILECAPTHEYGYYIEILLYSGLRRGELLALQWGDINIKEGLITVQRAIATSEEGTQEKGTKTDRVRYIGITASMENVLSRIPKKGIYVLCDDNGGRLTSSHFRKAYEKFFLDLNAGLQEDEQVAYLSPHKCRHTFATYTLKGGANLRGVQELLGHSTVQTTEIYTHIDTEEVKRNIRKLKY